jgi:hypothetical protein
MVPETQMKVSKIEAACRQLDAAIRMLFAGEDILAVHTVSRAAFRTLHSLTKAADTKTALEHYIRKIGQKQFDYLTNYLKHADRDPNVLIDDSFHIYTEAGIGMAISLYVYHANAITDEMKGYQIWSAMTQPKIFDIPNDLIKLVDDWKAVGRSDLDTRIEHRGDRDFGAALVHWIKLRDVSKELNPR